MSIRASFVRLGLRAFVKSRAGPMPDLAASRKGYNAIKSWVPNPPRSTKVTKHEIAGVKAVRVATPRSRPDRHMLYLHGGAYMNGSPSHYRDFIWRIADVTASSVLCIDYRLAPEYPFPAALDDAADDPLPALEAANEAARRAVNGILQQSGSSAPPAELWPLEEPAFFEPMIEYDRLRFKLGLPHAALPL